MEEALWKGNIILCGFMGAGKSTIGKRLAEKLGMRMIDADTEIERETGMLIPEIFREKGEGGFREIEYQTLARLADEEGVVLCPGGGAFTEARNVELLRGKGTVVFLNPGFNECYGRIKGSDRPLVRMNSPEQLEEIHRVREALYRRAAHIEVFVNGNIDYWADAVIKLMREEAWRAMDRAETGAGF